MESKDSDDALCNVQYDLNLHILRMFKGIFLLDMAHILQVIAAGMEIWQCFSTKILLLILKSVKE